MNIDLSLLGKAAGSRRTSLGRAVFFYARLRD